FASAARARGRGRGGGWRQRSGPAAALRLLALLQLSRGGRRGGLSRGAPLGLSRGAPLAESGRRELGRSAAAPAPAVVVREVAGSCWVGLGVGAA
ncbi:unnamed protein product, partial [Urochloa humidicola]